MKHLAIIMDWNRRWARSKMLPTFAWHKAWADNVVRIVDAASERGIKYITLWALSTENLEKRSKDEVQGIIKLVNHIESYLWKMKAESLKFTTIWDISRLPETSQKVIEKVTRETQDNDGIVMTLALIYGWQDEILRATQKILRLGIDPDTLTPKVFRTYTDVAHLPVPDMIVRTWWDVRHSWFLLFDSAYSEYYFTEKWWPAFTVSDLDEVINTFNSSKRNFWK